jgi:HAE1 family hydrophobic/amphiphilic exporter-1
MNIASFSIKRPVFIGCLVILMLVTGIIGLKRLGVDLFPPIDFPVVTVTTTYGGASPEEIESLITKPLEEQISTISGIKRLSSRNMEGVSIVIAEFTYETDIRYAEEKMREKVSLARNELPTDLEDEPLVRQFDITDSPVLTLAVTADLTPTELYDLVKERVKPLIEQVSGVGEVRLPAVRAGKCRSSSTATGSMSLKSRRSPSRTALKTPARISRSANMMPALNRHCSAPSANSGT